MKITFKKIAKSITGISTPIFGVSWNPPKIDRDFAQKLILYLEDRRVLFYPYYAEVSYHVTESIFEIRKYLTELLQQLDTDSALIPNIRSMGAACRKYLDVNPKSDKRHRHFGPEDVASLGELRGVFGMNLAEICVKYGINLDSELGDILPIEDVN